MNIKQTDGQYVASTYTRFGVELVRGEGAALYSADGKRYIDFGSGIGVNIFGACDPEWRAAVCEQLEKVQHTSNLYFTEPCAALAKLLCEKTGMKKVFFANSGAEANECAIKTARKYGDDEGKGRNRIVTLKNSFHGRTLATLTATGQDSFHQHFGPFPEGFAYADPNISGDLTRIVSEGDCIAVMIEPIQGEGGVNPLPEAFISELKKVICDFDLLLIVDEVQTGNGRTGKLYGYMHNGLQPDIVTTAKGLGGGLPIGAALFSERVQDVLTPGTHGSTFGGNPVACAGALNILSRIDEKLLCGVCEKSDFILSELSGLPGVKSIAGLGLMLGIETLRPAKEIISECMGRGLLVLSAKNKVRLLPPLNIADDLLRQGVAILKDALSSVPDNMNE